MAMASDGLRTIRVTGMTFGWTTGHRDSRSPIHIAVEPKGRLGSRLNVRTDQRSLLLANDDCDMEGFRPVLPSDVRRYILRAMELGWRPDHDRSPMFLIEADGVSRPQGVVPAARPRRHAGNHARNEVTTR